MVRRSAIANTGAVTVDCGTALKAPLGARSASSTVPRNDCRAAPESPSCGALHHPLSPSFSRDDLATNSDSNDGMGDEIQCADCVRAKAVTRSGNRIEMCRKCDRNSLKSKPEKINRQRHIHRKATLNHGSNGFLKTIRHEDQKRHGAKIIEKKLCDEENTSTDNDVLCKWLNCDQFVDASDLMHHLREFHVDTQSSSEMFVCLWTGCKVYDKSSCSLSWLERHVLSHSGAKPFKCLFDGCGSRFASHCALERHINTHFNAINHMQQKMAKTTNGDGTPSKPTKKRKRKRKQFKEVAGQDYFDSCTMDGIKYGLYRLATKAGMDTSHQREQNSSSPNQSTPTVTFHSTVISRRTELSGIVKLLLRWTPEDVLPDTWVPESQLATLQVQTIPLHHLPVQTITQLDTSLYKHHRYRKHRRK